MGEEEYIVWRRGVVVVRKTNAERAYMMSDGREVYRRAEFLLYKVPIYPPRLL